MGERSIKRIWVSAGAVCAALMLGACGSGSYAAKEVPPEQQLPKYGTDKLKEESIFGAEGLIGTLRPKDTTGTGIPVNKFLWQASLDTLSFLPLASTDPFTGVIATDWGAAPNRPGERFKVTAYMLDAKLAASSLKVAVYREVRGESGVWVPASVDPGTPRKLEDAILTRARQIKIAGLENSPTG